MGALCSQRIKRLLSLRSHAVRLAVYKARHKGCHVPKLEHVKGLCILAFFSYLVQLNVYRLLP